MTSEPGSGSLYGPGFVAAGNQSLFLGGDSRLRRQLFQPLGQPPGIDGAPVHIGDHRAGSHLRNLPGPVIAREIRRRSGLEDQADVRLNRTRCRLGSDTAVLLLDGEGAGEAVLALREEQFQQEGTTQTVIQCLGPDKALPNRA